MTQVTDALLRHGLDVSHPQAILPVGLPGSGKSSLADLLVEMGVMPRRAVVSTDTIRVGMGGRRNWVSDEGAVFAEADEQFRSLLSQREIVYLDATNLDPQRRQSVLHQVTDHGMRGTLVVFRVQPDEARRIRAASGIEYRDDVWDLLTGWFSDFESSHQGPDLDGRAMVEELRQL